MTAFQSGHYEAAEKYLRDALLKVESVCKGGGEEMVRSSFLWNLKQIELSQVSPCMADKWESLLSNLGHTYRKLRRLQQKLKREYERFLGMMRHCHSTSKHWS